MKLYLPRVNATAAEDDENKALPDEGGRETVLAVEDDPEMRLLVTQQMRALGYTILEASDGKAALAAMECAGHIDLLLSDLVLPGGISGIELAVIAHRQSGVKVLFMSGYTQDTMATHGRLGDDALLLQKPFRRSELAKMVREALAA